MVAIAITPTKITRGSHKWIWDAMGNADTGDALDPNGGSISFPDKTVHVHGVNWGSATLIIQGSNDGVNWETLTDPSNTALSFTSDALKVILESPLYIRPKTSGGTATDVNVIIAGRATLQLR